MKGTPDNTVILHWDECRMLWAKLSWHDWVRFRGYGPVAKACSPAPELVSTISLFTSSGIAASSPM